MRNTLNIFTFALMSAFFIYASLTIPVRKFGNANTDPEFVTIGDTVVVDLPLVEGKIKYKQLQAVEAVPVVINSDSIFWDTDVLEIKYELVAGKQTGRREVMEYCAKCGSGNALSSRTYKIEGDGIGGKRLIKMVVPDDMRLTGERLLWNLWFEDDQRPHEISIKISADQDRDKFVLYKSLRVGLIVMAVVSFLLLLGATLGRTGMAGTVMSRRLRAK